MAVIVLDAGFEPGLSAQLNRYTLGVFKTLFDLRLKDYNRTTQVDFESQRGWSMTIWFFCSEHLELFVMPSQYWTFLRGYCG
jgi:hypothetical protein